MDEIKEKVKVIIQKVTQFLKEAKVELKKVTWPTPKQTIGFDGGCNNYCFYRINLLGHS